MHKYDKQFHFLVWLFLTLIEKLSVGAVVKPTGRLGIAVCTSYSVGVIILI